MKFLSKKKEKQMEEEKQALKKEIAQLQAKRKSGRVHKRKDDK